MPLGMEIGFGPGHIVLDGNPAFPHNKGHNSPYFSAHVCCGQTAGWITIIIIMQFLTRHVSIGYKCHLVQR